MPIGHASPQLNLWLHWMVAGLCPRAAAPLSVCGKDRGDYAPSLSTPVGSKHPPPFFLGSQTIGTLGTYIQCPFRV